LRCFVDIDPDHGVHGSIPHPVEQSMDGLRPTSARIDPPNNADLHPGTKEYALDLRLNLTGIDLLSP
jgi:hypothetical protein